MSEDIRTNYIRKLVAIAAGTDPHDRGWLIKELGEALESVSQETFQQRELLQGLAEVEGWFGDSENDYPGSNIDMTRLPEKSAPDEKKTPHFERFPMKPSQINFIQRQVFAQLNELCDEHEVSMSVDQLAKLSSIVLEHMLEAAAPPKPMAALECPICQSTATYIDDSSIGTGVAPLGCCRRCTHRWKL